MTTNAVIILRRRVTKDKLILELARRIRRWVKSNNGPWGWCLDASLRLAHLLNKHHIENHMVKGHVRINGSWSEPHWWIVIGRRILDVTIDQFSGWDEGFNPPAVFFSTNKAIGNRYERD